MIPDESGRQSLTADLMAPVPEVVSAALDRGPQLVIQPIVDLARGVPVGYEVLSRFDGLTPLEAFAAAERGGIGAELDAAVIRAAGRLRARLPPNCFLSINVGPQHLPAAVVRSALDDFGSLRGVVLEVTEHAEVADCERLEHEVAGLRERGLALAVDDAGAGYASMRHITVLRPEFVKVDRIFVAGIDRDTARAALVEMLGSFAGRLDAWLVAEGVEDERDLAALQRLRVPLAQGFLLARPASPWPPLPAELSRTIVEQAERTRGDSVAGLIEGGPALRGEARGRALLAADDQLDFVLLLDEWDRPLRLLGRDGSVRSTLRISPTAAVADVARRAIARSERCRFDPAICCDESGRYVGVVRIERLVERLAR